MVLDTPRINSRLELLYLVTSEFNAGLDINEVLFNVLTATVASVGASDASLFLIDQYGALENNLILGRFKKQIYPPETLQRIFSEGLVEWVWRQKKGVIVADTRTAGRWYKDDITPEIQRAISAVSVPIQKSPDPPLGVLTITTDKPDFFDESDLAMLTIVADQAAFAFTNARLFKAEQHRRRIADTLSSIAYTINSTLNLTEVLDLILEHLSLVVEYDSSSVLLHEEESGSLAVHAARGFEDMDDALNVRLPFDENIPNYQAIIQKKPVVIGDVDAEPNWIKSSSSERVKSWIGVPLVTRNQVVGILTVDSYQPNKYSEENIEVVAAFANQAATAVANAQAVSRLQKAEASYSALFEDSTDMIVITDYNGIIRNVNRKACQILRRPKDAVIDLNISFFAPQLKDFLSEHIKLLQVWRETSVEVEITDAYRQKIPLEIRVRHIQFGDKERVEWVGRDISKRKETERMRQDLVNMLVHDLRGPLGNLINTIDLLTMMVDTNANRKNMKRFLEMGKRTGRMLTDLVDSMLDVSRLEQGQVPLQCSMTSLASLLKEVEEQVVPQATAKRTEITIGAPPPELHQFWLDNSLLRRVLTNLVGNAIKYSPNHAQVSLSTTIEDNCLHFTVKDNGPGIDPANHTRIFNKFSRIDYSTNGPAGVGLGLAFCKLAVEAHHGSIWVNSDGTSGQGSTFHVCIPIILEPT